MSRLIALGLVISFLLSAAAKAEGPVVDEAVRHAMQNRDYQAAIKAIDKASADPKGPRDYLAYLKGRALHLSEKYDDAIKRFDTIEKEFPKSNWARRARFAMAISHARKGDYRSAELIYRREADYLLSTDRKQQIANLYLEFADTYFKPAKIELKPNYQKALDFYNRALAVGPKEPRRIEVELQVAQCYQNLGNFKQAALLYKKFVQEHPKAKQIVEAKFRLGESQLKLDQQTAARRTWRDMLAAHPDHKSPRIAEATFKISLTYRLPKPTNDEDLSLGVASLESFVSRFPDHKLASVALLRIGESYGHRGRYNDAATHLSVLLESKKYAARDEIAEARNLLGRCLLRQKKFTEALATWREYLSKHPTHKSWSDVQRAIVDTQFTMAAMHREAKKYDDARKLWEEFLAKFPLDSRARAIWYEFGQMHYDQKKWDEAKTDWTRLISKYPGSREASRAEMMIGVILEEKHAKLEAALRQYRKVTGPYKPHATRRIAQLTAKSLVVATERVFRSDETPTIKLTSRNLENVKVEVYAIDLETYFRKMHLARGVEGLDIALIDPDHRFEFKLPKYEAFQKTEHNIKVPLPKNIEGTRPSGGAMAVTVSSKTLTTTTLVLQSDLDIVVKSSRNEVFVLAENMRTGKAWPKVRLLISDGKKVFGEGITGDDGLFQHDYKQLASVADVRVFAVVGANVASNIVGLQGIGIARGLSEKGYVYTDRPAYRPGDMVHLRGIIRSVKDDRYTVDEGASYQIQVLDTRGRMLHEDEIKLSGFGSFHSHFILPDAATQGNYRILVTESAKTIRAPKTYQGSFGVHQYKLEPVQINIETERTVFYRGEEIEGKIAAKFYYGAPLVDREIRYQLAGGPVITAKTDAKGEVAIKLPTREYRESQVLPLVVTLSERNLRTAKNFYLSTQGYNLGVSTIRPVYLSGESFEVTVKATDAEGKPASRKLMLKVLKRTKVNGKIGERFIAEHQLSTDDKEGVARQTLTLKEGGTYIVRAEGTDRFDNPITGTGSVRLSDDKDRVRLRLLANRHTLKVGDKARVNLHWREKPALALITFQGARVLDHRLVMLNKGDNKLELPMTARLAPNFELAVAVMTDPRKVKNNDDMPVVRLHTASSPFSVSRDLRVKLAIKPKDGKPGRAKPGQKVDVEITTTDPQGRPVSAELSLAMIEQSLLDRFGSPNAAIGAFFRAQTRQTAVRTTSSVTFGYRPSTRAINPRLLAEVDRKELEESEKSRVLLRGAAGRFGYLDQQYPEDGLNEASIQSDLNGLMRQSLAMPSQSETSASNELTNDNLDLDRTDALDMPRSEAVSDKQWAQAVQSFSRNQRENDFFDTGLGREKSLTMSDGRSENQPVGGYFVAPEESKLTKLAESYHRNVAVFYSRSGKMTNLDLTRIGASRTSEVAFKLQQAGALLLPHLLSQETGYWNPSVTTDKDGHATVTVTLPDRSTAWKLLAKGISVETLAGEADQELVVKKELFGQLKLPMAFTDGDDAQIVATIHHPSVKKGKIEVTLTTTIGDKTEIEKKTLDAGQQGAAELVFKQPIRLPSKKATPADADATFELMVTAGQHKDILRRTVAIRPFGLPVFRTAGGSSSADTTAWVESPKNVADAARSLQVIIGPTVEQSLLSVVFGSAPRCQIANLRIASGLDVACGDLMASLALQRLIGKTREAKGPQARSLDTRVRSSLSLLVAAQNDDGGWSWTGRGGTSNRYMSARVLWALSLARQAGYTVKQDGFDRATNFLASQIAKTSNSDYQSKAILLHALSTAGRSDFALANRLHRNRQSLSASGLLYLTLAWAEMDRKSMAEEVLKIVATRDLDQVANRRPEVGTIPWSQSPTELRALYALAIQTLTPHSAEAKKQTDWLMAHRSGNRWSPEKATGPAMLALAAWHGKNRVAGTRYKLSVFVNDRKVKELDIDDSTGTETIDVAAEHLVDGKQRINFQLTGRGRFTYQCILGGFVPAKKLASTTKDWVVTRTYEPAPLELDGKPIPRGFGVLQGSYKPFRNPLTQLPVGRRGQVELRVNRHGIPSNFREEQLEYLVVTEPLPSGATVIESSVRGGFERFEINAGSITFYIGTRRYVQPIHYHLHGYLPGEYRAAPTVIRDAYRPERLAVAKPKSLAVLPLGGKSKDAYRLTPQELYELGKRHYAKKNHATAGKHLGQLLAKWNLRPSHYKEASRMLLDVHLEQGPASQVVRYFEIIKEKWPELEIPFAKIVKVGAAYHEMGEYERAYLIFRATVESSFSRENGVAGFLQAQGEFTRSIDEMTRIMREYPPESYIAAANYALAQEVYAKAPHAADDAKLREKKIHRVDLIRQAHGMLESFLTAYPHDPAADKAAFSAANALLDLKDYESAIAACNAYSRRYAQSDYLDSYWYLSGYCHFAQGQHEKALDLCKKVAKAKRTDRKTGRQTESTNKWPAIYIMGQIYHSMGDAAKAITEYDRVKQRFADAAQAINYFARKEIKLPEVTNFKPGEKTSVTLAFRNVAECDVKVYRIDLMKFSLLRRNLGGITRINLAGIGARHEETIKLGDGKDYRAREKKITLPMTEEGAYLVVARGENLHASGLVLVTPLVIEVSEDATSGRVRTTVKDQTKGNYVSDVHVKVIGTSNSDFTSGESDLRGIFVADGIRGTTTVIAQLDASRYAFHRGTKHLGAPPAPSQPTNSKPMSRENGQKRKADELLKGLKNYNKNLLKEQQKQLQDFYEEKQEGVKTKDAF